MISRSSLRVTALFALLILTFSSAVVRAEYEESFSYSAESLKIVNLIGAM